jgi:thioredoxin reductase
MGLIRNAIEQGRQALATIAGQLAARDTAAGCDLDLLIVGAGPAGISATLAAMQAGLNHRTIEQHMLGGTVASFPRGKVVMTAPSVLPLVGEVPFKETSKEALLDFWNGVRRDTGMEVSYGERLLAVETMGSSLRVTTSAGSYQCRAVLLAIGRRGTPRKLEVPGEGQGKVKYSLLDPADHRGQQVVVVGGGDSALEAACSIAMEAGSEVTLCYRGAAFTRARKKNRERLESLMAEGRVQVLLESSVIAIGKDDVLIEHQGGKLPRPNDAVIVCAGGILPNGLLREIGVAVETKYGTR